MFFRVFLVFAFSLVYVFNFSFAEADFHSQISDDSFLREVSDANLKEKLLNTKDTTPPKVSLVSPFNNSVVSGEISLYANAFDDNKIKGVVFYLDNEILGKDTEAPYSFLWNSKAVKNGVYKLYVKASDEYGNVAISREVMIGVENKDDEKTDSKIVFSEEDKRISDDTLKNSIDVQKDSESLKKIATTTPKDIQDETVKNNDLDDGKNIKNEDSLKKINNEDILNPSLGIVKGRIINDKKQVLKEISGEVYLQTPSGEKTSFSGSVSEGRFLFSAPEGEYILRFLTEKNVKNLSIKDGISIEVKPKKVKRVQIEVVETMYEVRGFVKDDSGKILKGVDVKVFASKDGYVRKAKVNKETGEYKIMLPEGKWFLNFKVDDEGYLKSKSKQSTLIEMPLDASSSFDLVLKQAKSKINVFVEDGKGNPISKVKISVFKILEDEDDNLKRVRIGDWFSKKDGKITISLSKGDYIVRAYGGSSLGLVNPKAKKVSLESGEVLNINLPFRVLDGGVSGRVLLDGVGVKAFVFAWSENGGYVQTKTTDNGSYELKLKKGEVWSVGASAEILDEFYKSAESSVNIVDSDNKNLNLKLRKIERDIPKSIKKILDKEISQTVSLDDGAEVSLPANVVSGMAEHTLSVDPVADVPALDTARVVGGVGYDIEIKDEKGNQVTTLNEEITIKIPYKKDDIDSLGADEDSLQPAFWDEETSSWSSIEDYVIDKINKVVVASVAHLTRFALIAPADVTPPQAPLNVNIAEIGGGKIKITWDDPKVDFHHAKVYRSNKKGELGSLIFDDVFSSEVVDDLVLGSYYTIKSIDLAGNASENTDQYFVDDFLSKKSSVNLIRVKGDPRVYRIVNEKKIWIPTEEAFKATGYSWSDVKVVDEKEANKYPYSSLVKSPSDPKVYFINENGTKRHIPNPQVFESYGYKWSDIVEIEKTELDAYTQTRLLIMEGDYKVYELKNNIRRWIQTEDALFRLGYKKDEIVKVNKEELFSYDEMDPLK